MRRAYIYFAHIRIVFQLDYANQICLRDVGLGLVLFIVYNERVRIFLKNSYLDTTVLAERSR